MMSAALLVLCSIAISDFTASPDYIPGGCARARAALAAQQRDDGAGVAGGGLITADNDTDLLHNNLDIEIDPVAQWLGGSNTMTVRSMTDGLSTFRFRLDSALHISAVQVNGVDAAWVRIDSAVLEVTLDRAYNSGEEFDLRVEYDGNPVSRGFGSIVFDTHDGASAVFTLSETWFAYTWWPTKDDNADKSTADLAFTVPADMVVASNGTLIAVDDLGAQKRYVWATDYPMATYLYSFAATNYSAYTRDYVYDGGTMPVDIFLYPESDSSSHREAWFRTIDMMAAFEAPFGLYPFIDEKYGVCQFGFGGGMEHQTITGQGTFSEWVTAHELGHQWWGDMVTCATWHDIWLNEGFATYAEALWYELKPGSSGTPALLNHMANRRPSRFDGSVYVYDISNMNRIFSTNFSYRKGAWVLHMLRHVAGDETFFDILHGYRAAFELGAATTDDFRAVAEGVAGRDLQWFFEEWVYQIGAPRYEYAWRQSEVAGRNMVEIYLRQTQDASYPIFDMPIDIVTTDGGGETVNVVWNDAESEHLLFETPAAIGGLELDPDHWILSDPTSHISFVEGPPKIVDVSIRPGDEVPRGAASAIDALFHKDVVISAQNVSLTGDVSGAREFELAYDATTQTATLRPVGLLPADHYTLVISDEVVDVAAGLALDGELDNVGGTPLLPSGDGLAGGDAVVEFDVVVLLGDVNCDGTIDTFDIEPFLLALFDPDEYPIRFPDCDISNADINSDGTINAFDIEPFLELLFP